MTLEGAALAYRVTVSRSLFPYSWLLSLHVWAAFLMASLDDLLLFFPSTSFRQRHDALQSLAGRGILKGASL